MLRVAVAFVAILTVMPAATASAQELLTGRVIEAGNGEPVPTAGVFLLDGDRKMVASAVAGDDGSYRLDVPGSGEYIIHWQRLGYTAAESPLLALTGGGERRLDLELKPEPILLDPIEVTVRNETMEAYLRREFGTNPNSIFGFRAVQGERLRQAKEKSSDNTGLLRQLYIPVSHGREVCFGHRMPGVPRGSGSMYRPQRIVVSQAPCGGLVVDGIQVPAEHIDSFDKDSIAVVVFLPPNVYLYTRDFKWDFRPGRH